MISKHSNTR